MTERPILFSAPMVRAILAGTKTQTRRVMKPDGRYRLDVVAPADGGPSRCPYGQPGDRLWARETWAAPHNCDHLKPSEIDSEWRFHYAATEDRGGLLWRPSIHMPRRASRITLEVTGVRVERLQDISEADAIAEGIGSRQVSENDSRWLNYMDPESKAAAFGDPRYSFWSLWENINGEGSVETNPWVRVIAFRRIKP